MQQRKYRTAEEAIREMKEINPNVEILSDYVNMNTKMKFRCNICGHEFENSPRNIINRHQGCKKCSDKANAIRRTKSIKQFVEEARAEHGDKYDYSLVNYQGAFKKIQIICPKHGIFEQIPDSHIRGCGCPKCKFDWHVVTEEEFLNRVKEKFGDKFDLSKMNYIDYTTPITIICPIHGEFEMTPQALVNCDNGCPECGKMVQVMKRSDTTESFIEKARKVHGDKYDYSLVQYVHSKIPVKIICPKHGIFEQKPVNHLVGKGCPYCANSKGETFISNYLKEKEIPYTSQYLCRFGHWRLYADFYLMINNKEYVIEYNGRQHYYPVQRFGGEERFQHQVERDQALKEYCECHNINYVEIRYDWKHDKIISILDNIINTTC